MACVFSVCTLFKFTRVNVYLKNFCSNPNSAIMKYLNVAEKNDAAKNIASFLSRGSSKMREGLSRYNKIYEFSGQVFGEQSWMMMTSVSGHLLNYEFVGHYKSWQSCSPVELFDAPVQKFCLPDYEMIKKTLEREIRSCQGLIIWTDCDREGENIGFEIIKVCTDVKPDLRIYRAKFSEITAASVWRALNTLTQPNKNVSDAVDVRQELDLRTGAAFTRLQTLRLQKVFPQTLADKLISYGSCQFPTLGFVVERYQAIEDFISEPFWRIKMNHTVGEISSDFNWGRDRLFDKLACEAILDICKENPQATVENIESKEKSKWRPLPLDTVEMEKSVSRKLKINAKETMRIAEKLYTQGYISYPRTETNIFPKELNLTNLVEQQRNDPRWGPFAQRIMSEGGPTPRQGKKTDQAHPPIHPTKAGDNLTGNEQRLYEYIVRHFLACVHKDAKGFETTVNVDIAGEKFTTKGLIVLEKNYLEVYIYEKWNAKEINNYRVGDTFMPTVLDIVESSTSPPKLLTEADLIALMERHGIGTDATHAEHIDKIKSREYVGLHENIYFIPGTLGMGLVEGYNNMELEVSLAKPVLRAQFENDLKLICDGLKDPEVVRRAQIESYRAVFQRVMDNMRLIDDSLATRLSDRPQPVADNEINDQRSFQPVMKCPKCGSSMILRDRKTGPGKYLACSNYPQCQNAVWIPNNITNVTVTDQHCPVCGPQCKKLEMKFKQNMFPGEPNPNVLCIGGCDRNVLETLDIDFATVNQASANQTPNNGRTNVQNQSRTFTGNNTLANNSIQNVGNLNGPTGNTFGNTSHNSGNTPAPRNNFGNNPGPPRNNFGNNPGPPRNNFGNNPGPPRNSFDSPGNNFGNAPATPRNNFGSNSGPPRSNLGNMPGPSRNSFGNKNSTDDDNQANTEIVCSCNQEARQFTVRKEGPNQGRQFYKCASDSCKFFLWAPTADENVSARPPTMPVNNRQNSTGLRCGCNNPAVKRTVAKEGANTGREFFTCTKPRDAGGCGFFKWADEADDSTSNGNWASGSDNQTSWTSTTKPKKTNRTAPYSKPSTTTRAPPKCGICRETGHTKRNCPNK